MQMHLLSLRNLHTRDQSIPYAVAVNCPYCGGNVIFNTPAWHSETSTKSLATRSLCPGCRRQPLFIAVPNGIENSKKLSCYDYFVYPGPKVRLLLPGIEHSTTIAPLIKQEYVSAVNVINAREWTVAAVLCRRLLEGILQGMHSEASGTPNLAKQIRDLANKADLTKPIMTLADAIRKGGNLAAHFNLEKQADEEIATNMLELIEHMLEYLFVIPEQTEALHERVERLSPTIEV